MYLNTSLIVAIFSETVETSNPTDLNKMSLLTQINLGVFTFEANFFDVINRLELSIQPSRCSNEFVLNEDSYI